MALSSSVKKLFCLAFAVVGIVSIAACSVTKQNPSADEPSSETAHVSIAENALAGGMRIVAVDGEPVQQINGIDLPPGDHQVSVACRLDNGISTTFAFDVSLEPNHSYCFFSQNQGKACSIVYTKIGWKGKGIVSCR